MTQSIIRKLFLTGILIAIDVAAIIASFALAYYTRAWLFADLIPILSPMLHGFDLYAKSGAILVLWPIMFAYEGMYPSVGISYWEETKSILKGNCVAFLILVLLTFVTRTSIQFSRPVVFLAFLCSLVALPVMRLMARSLLRRMGQWSREVILVGGSETAAQVICNLKKHPDWGLKPKGIVLPEGDANTIGLPLLGTIEQLEKINVRASEVIVAMPELDRRDLVDIIERASRIAPVVKVLPDLYGLASVGVKTHDLDGMLFLEMEDRLALRRNSAAKRTFDLICSFSGLVALSPFLLLIMAMIRLDSKGPVFFGHKRVGKGGKYFTCYKFRTMKPNAAELLDELLASDPEAKKQWEKDFKLKDDPRITKIGAFLRKTSLDELPQLWNVIKGEMSLVGPRPIVSDEVEKYGEKARYLFKVVPGITGLWQVSGRNDIDYEERVLLDEYYAKNWSLWLDIEVLIRTFSAVLMNKGAY
ncbi:MAG TPA: undecaprenyl-phosphate galactose phosphotransferase WbaP [Deltaproteobacteria bacterium]|nr:undecaprenyl-phosphate galactose phosphotransferase WbaP [Deltaproteobacteria bacterium]